MKGVFFLCLVVAAKISFAQIILQNNPAHLKWYQINSPNFKVLFPEGSDQQAQRVVNTLEHIHEPEAQSLGSHPRKIPIVLQNQSSLSNAFVSLLPRRAEFYMMPSQDYNFSGTNDWLNLIIAHEYRHVVQYQHATRGFNRLFYYLFGNQALHSMSQFAAPLWFWEGDAVATETAFTPSGRGRIPHFSLVFKTNLMEGRTFNYHKQYLRSYKHNIPDHYVLGYHMVSYLRRRTGDANIWGKISAQAWSVPFIPFAFSNAIKSNASLSVTKLYNQMVSDLKKEWKTELDSLALTPFETVNRRKNKTYTDYAYPQPLEDGSVLVMKKGIGEIEKFILLKPAPKKSKANQVPAVLSGAQNRSQPIVPEKLKVKEKRVFTPGFINESGMLSAVNGTVVWNEYGYDPRWRVRNFSIVKAYNFNLKLKHTVSYKKSWYGSAALSPDGKKIVTVQTDNHYLHSLIVLTYPDGNLLHEYPNPENYYYSMPRFSDDSRITVLKTTPQGKTISVFNDQAEGGKDVLPISQENLGHPVLTGNYLFFNSPISGIDNIYSVDLQTGKRYQVTSSKYGAYNPAVTKDQKFIYYNEQTRNGLDVVKIPFDPSLWKPWHIDEEKRPELADVLARQEGTPNLLDSVPRHEYPIRRYSRLKGIINPFSWGTLISNDLTKVDIGIASRDILSTTHLSAGYTFDLNERTGYWRSEVSFQGWYPIVDFKYTQGNRSIDGEDIGDITNRELTWKEESFITAIRLPLITTRSKYAGSLSIGNEAGLMRLRDYPFFAEKRNREFIFNHGSLSAQRLLKMSRRDIYSKWGQSLLLDYYHTPYGGDLKGELFSGTAWLFFPGFLKHHSINGYVAFQQEKILAADAEAFDEYVFRNTIPLPRGHNVYRFEKILSVSGNYTFPLWYPDIALGPFLNFQRVRLNMFYDVALGNDQWFSGGNTTFSSVGAEVKFDINVMRYLPQLDIGFRYAHGVTPAVTRYEILIGTFNF